MCIISISFGILLLVGRRNDRSCRLEMAITRGPKFRPLSYVRVPQYLGYSCQREKRG
jgi:hypothetical protein